MSLYTDYIEKARDLANSVYDQGVKALSKTETERRLAEALSHANWGASTTLMGEIAQSTNDVQEFEVIMREIWAACAATGRNWRVCYKGLALLEFLLKNGHKRVIEEAKENRSKIRKLEVFSYVKDGVEKGNGVREKAKAVTEILDDEDLLKRERAEAAKLRAKFMGVGRDGQHGGSFSTGGGYDDFNEKNSDKSDSDDEKSKKKSSKKKSSKKKDDSDNEEDEDEKPSTKSKSKKKQADDSEDEDFSPKFSKKETSKASKKKDDDDEDDFSPKFSAKGTSKASKKKDDDDDDDDFGFGDQDTKKKPAAPQVKVGPIKSISVKIPGANSSSSSSSATAAATKKNDDVDLLGDFDPFGSSASAPATKPAQSAAPVAAAVPKQQQQSAAANILDMFNTPAPSSSASNNGFAFPSQQPGFPSMAPAPAATAPMFPTMAMPPSQPAMGNMFPQAQPMMPGMVQQPMGSMTQMQQPMMMPQMGQPQMMMAPRGAQPMMMGQQPMMMQPIMGVQQPQMGMGFAAMGQPMGQAMKPQTPPQPQVQKKDAFSGLMDFSAPAPPKGPPSQSLI